MFRLFFLLALMPTYAAADWSPRPAMFTYDATFDQCTQDRTAPDLARTCADFLNAAYVLKRAIAWAAFRCYPDDLFTCAAPFEEEGLPAIAVRIAVDVNCEATDVSTLPEGEPISPNHCISVASDIMIDEGVVPLFNEISCGVQWIECGDLAQINAAFWANQVSTAVTDDPALVADLQSRNQADCEAQARASGGWAVQLDTLNCTAERSAALWLDLSQTEQDN